MGQSWWGRVDGAEWVGLMYSFLPISFDYEECGHAPANLVKVLV